MTSFSKENKTPFSDNCNISKDHSLSSAIIGGGKISEQHLATLKDIDGVHIAGICDLSPALARFTTERFNVPNWYTDYRAMLEKCEADVVHVLTPPATHDLIVRDCLNSGRHVIVEKPVSLSHAGFQKLWDYAAARNLRLIENHNYRFNHPIRQLERIVNSGRIGTVQDVEVRMVLNIRGGGRYADENLPHPSHRLPAGIVHEFISHLAYLLLHFMPHDSFGDIGPIRAAWRNHGGGTLFTYDDLDALVIAGAVHGRIRFSCRQWPDCFSVQVRGSDGVATAELFHPTCQVITRRPVGQHLTPLVNALAGARTMAQSGFGSIWRKIRNRSAYEGLSRFLELAYEALRTGGEPPVSFRQMDETSRLVDALLDMENRI
jgi:predicted dehydrogenase